MTARRKTSPHRRNPAGERTTRDEQIMRRWDSGRSIEQIAAATDICPDKVQHIVGKWDEGDLRRRTYNAARRGCAKLRAAIEQYHRNFQPRERAPAE